MKRILLTLLLTFVWIFSCSQPVLAQQEPTQPEVVITFFWREGCSHCAAEKPVLQELATQNPQINLKAYEVYYDNANREYLYALGEALGFETTGVPVTVIGEQVWVGFGAEDEAAIRTAVENCLASGCPDPSEKFSLDLSGTTVSLETEAQSKNTPSQWWIIAAVMVFTGSYALGVALRKNKTVKKKQKKH